MSPKKKSSRFNRINEGQAEVLSPASGSIPDPEALDFEEYEDEDAGAINQNGEQNEEPDVTGDKKKTDDIDSNY